MMQMSDTHSERRRVRHTFKAWRGEREVAFHTHPSPSEATPHTSRNYMHMHMCMCMYAQCMCIEGVKCQFEFMFLRGSFIRT